MIGVLGAQNPSLWTDEAATVSAATRSLPELWRLVQQVDAVHGAYYLFMHFWTGAFGITPFALRFPSAIAAGLGAAGVVLLGRRLFTAQTAVIAGVVFSVLPRVTWMGTEARSFAFTAAVAVWLTLLLLVALRSGRWAWVGYSVLGGIGVALNVYVALLVVAHAVTVLFAGPTWRKRLQWAAAAIIAAGLAAPVLMLSSSESGQIGDNRLTPSALLVRAAVNEFFLGETPTGVHVPQGGSALWKYGAVALAALAWLMMLLAVVRRRAMEARVRAPGAPNSIAVLVPWLVLPTVVVGGYSLLGHSLYNPRYFTFCAGAAALLIAAGIGTLRRPALRITAVALIAVLALPVIVSQRTTFAKSGADFSVVAAMIDAQRGPDEGVYFAPEPATNASTVVRTSRQIEIAYPEAFAGLRDVTETSGPATDGTLWGTDRRLVAAQSRLAGLRELFVIRRRDYPAATAATEDVQLRADGFRLAATTVSTVHSVERWIHR